MSPEAARHRAALRLAFAATLALVWGTMVGEPLPGLTAVLAAQILVGMPRPPRLAPSSDAGRGDRGYGRRGLRCRHGLRGPVADSDGCARVAVLPRFCDARTGGGPALAPRHHAAERHRGGPGPHGPSGHPGGRRARRPSSPRRYGRCSSSGFSTRSFPAPPEETTTGAAGAAAAATGMPVTNTTARRVSSPRSPSCCRHNFSTSPSPQRSPFRHCSGSSPSCPRRIPRPGAPNSLILLLGNLVGSVAAAAASVVLEIGPPLPALTLMALLGSLGFARWIMTAGRRPGGAVALTGLVTFLMLFGLAASPVPFDVPVLDRVADIAVLSLYTVGATALLLPLPAPLRPAGHGGPTRRAVTSFRQVSGTAPNASGHHV